uniref:Beta-galactosidase beta-sandwich domain-containing protein n=1 Tax=Nelumbo nucifera TaxID=4432 RepID=A0A822ZU07_NELNU|nr:TPA_asm: hypothetical protein HUJ06_018649 [Nelumbo nucifera]
MCYTTITYSLIVLTIVFHGQQYSLPAWSVSILSDCKQEVYSTAKKAEDIRDTAAEGKGFISAKGLREQKSVTSDASDYLWYMTRSIA